MDYQSMFTFMLEMAGTIAFAASGAMVGAQRGMDIFGVCVLGVVTAVFRLFGGSAEGVSYAIIFCNLLVPLIEKATYPAAFGKGGKKS